MAFWQQDSNSTIHEKIVHAVRFERIVSIVKKTLRKACRKWVPSAVVPIVAVLPRREMSVQKLPVSLSGSLRCSLQ
jgi:hypothetical protein